MARGPSTPHCDRLNSQFLGSYDMFMADNGLLSGASNGPKSPASGPPEQGPGAPHEYNRYVPIAMLYIDQFGLPNGSCFRVGLPRHIRALAMPRGWPAHVNSTGWRLGTSSQPGPFISDLSATEPRTWQRKVTELRV